MNDNEIEQIANPTFELKSEFKIDERFHALYKKEVDEEHIDEWIAKWEN